MAFWFNKSSSSIDTAATDDMSVQSNTSRVSTRNRSPRRQRSDAHSVRRPSVSQNKLDSLFRFAEPQQQQQSPYYNNYSNHGSPLKPLREQLDFGHHEDAVENLRYTVWDLVALTAATDSFEALKRSLRQNGAVTNEMLKQGLPLFMHRNREALLSNYFQELDREQEENERQMAALGSADLVRGYGSGGPGMDDRKKNLMEAALDFTLQPFRV